MKQKAKVIVALAMLMVMLLAALPAQAICAETYVVQSTSPYGYCYLYSNPSDRDGISRNLGRYDNGSLVYVLNYYGGRDGKFNYCLVMTYDGQVGYMHDYSLVYYDDAALDYWSYDGPEYYIYSTDPYGYCYLYSEPSDINGTNLGRYENYDRVKVIEYYGGNHGRFNYSLVITEDNRIGYVHDYVLQYMGW